MRRRKPSKISQSIGAVVWVFTQLSLILVLFFWPRADSFGWPETVWSVASYEDFFDSSQPELVIDTLTTNFVIYVGVSLVALALLKVSSK